MVCLKGKVTMITGASSGIGAAVAVHFASLGSSVAVNGRNVEKLKQTVEACIKAGLTKDQVLSVIGDVSNEEEAASIVQKTVAHFGKLDILINNAGFSITRPVLENVPLSDFDQIMTTNVRAVFHMCQLAAPHLKKTKGNIVNVSSAVAHRVFAASHIYCTSKAALDHMTKSLALELAKDGVRCNAVNPGGIKTNFFVASGIPEEQNDVVRAEVAKMHALGRMGEAMEIAKPIAFMASDDASFITGATLLVDGGFVLQPPVS